ncbi:DUF6055 domain-containing protein, partial [Streptomyces sp. NPDC002920]
AAKSVYIPASWTERNNFDPNGVITQLENLYSFYVNTMAFTPETGLLAQHKIIVIVTRTWNRTELDSWVSGGSVDDTVGIINVAPGAALSGSWETSAEFMAMQALPTTSAGDLTRWLRSENLYWSSSRHHYGNWMLAQYGSRQSGIAVTWAPVEPDQYADAGTFTVTGQVEGTDKTAAATVVVS